MTCTDCNGKDPECFLCNGTGVLCDKCGEPMTACECTPDGSPTREERDEQAAREYWEKRAQEAKKAWRK